MSIPNEYFCPNCGNLWDLEVCDCGFIDGELVTVPERFKKREVEPKDLYRNKRNRRKKPREKGKGEGNG